MLEMLSTIPVGGSLWATLLICIWSKLEMGDASAGVPLSNGSFFLGRGFKQMTLESIVVTNKCSLPVYFREGLNARVEPGATVWFRDPASVKISNRLSFTYDSHLFDGLSSGVSEKMQFLELAIGQWPLHTPINQGGFNFVSQAGFIDMNLEIAGWKDRPGGQLICEDARAKTTYRMSDCQDLPDATLEEHGLPDGLGAYSRCMSKYGSACTTCEDAAPGCTSRYAVYVDKHSWLYRKSTSRWYAQARSVGSKLHGFSEAKFADGTTGQSTISGRDEGGVAVNFECWELPCLEHPEYCKQRGYVSTGNQGFMFCPDTGDFTIGALEVVTCPTGGDSPGDLAGEHSWIMWLSLLLLLLLFVVFLAAVLRYYQRHRLQPGIGSPPDGLPSISPYAPSCRTSVRRWSEQQSAEKPFNSLKDLVWVDAPTAVQSDQPALLRDIRACYDLVTDQKGFENGCEELFASLRRNLRKCPRDPAGCVASLHASTTLGTMPGKEHVLHFLFLVAERRPIYRTQVIEVTEILESSPPWKHALISNVDLFRKREQLLRVGLHS